MKKNKKIVVLYHKNCPDGFSAAWVAWKKLGNSAEYIATNFNEPPLELLSGKNVFLLDISFPQNITGKIKQIAKSLVSIDHHKMMLSSIKTADKYLFNNSHSGAVLAWKYFYPNTKIPKLLLYIEEYDLWKFKLPWTREISAFINAHEYDFKLWGGFAKDLENKKKIIEYKNAGSAIFKYQNYEIKHAVNAAEEVIFLGKKVRCSNSSILEDGIGNMLSRKKPHFGIVWRQKKDKINVSMRSIGNVDVAKMAKKFGGGGHKNASGFSFSANKPFPWKEIKMKK